MILQSTEESWGAEQSARYSAAIDAVLSRIATYPEIGVVRPATGDVRSFPVERHLMLYRVNARGVRILRVVHQRMNLDDIELD